MSKSNPVLAEARHLSTHPSRAGSAVRTLVIGLAAFLTVVDLFATQAILPSLAVAYKVSPAAMGFAVNASTMGMAVASLIVAVFSHRIDRRLGILLSLAALSVPTAFLAIAPDLTIFTLLRISQGVFMATAFTLTLAYLGENCSAEDTAGAFAAYITGNVASNLFGRLMAASIVDHLGIAANFYIFSALNLAGALLVYVAVEKAPPMPHVTAMRRSIFGALAQHLANPALRYAFAIGCCILFAFIGTFTYVNFVLVRPPIALGMMSLGFVYFVFLPSIITTPLAGRAVARLGTRPTVIIALAVAVIGLPLLLSEEVAPGAAWLDACRHGHLLCAGGRDRVRRPGGNLRPGRRERHLPCLLFFRRPRRHRRSWADLRPVRLGRVPCGDRSGARPRDAAGVAPRFTRCWYGEMTLRIRPKKQDGSCGRSC